MHTPRNIRRPPHEYASMLLEVSRGCTYNRCLFCNLYQGSDFSLVPLEHIAEDLDELAAETSLSGRVLLIGGNPLGLPNEKVLPILDLINEKLPGKPQISGYMRTADLRSKSDADLAALAERGVTDVTLGTECAWNPALERMRKGHTAEDILAHYPRLTAAGIGYSLFYLGGFAGAGLCEESARESAKVFSRLEPIRITVMTMTPYPGCQLRGQVERGEFTLAPESEVMRDVAAFIEGLSCETLIVGSHDSNLFRIDGVLPRDREGIVATLRMRAAQVNDRAMGTLRMKMLAM